MAGARATATTAYARLREALQAEPVPAPVAKAHRKPKHAAVLVHGIGPHLRYEITDDFVSGVRLVEDVRRVEVVFPQVRRNEATLVTHARRIEFADPAKPTLDVFEVYWAPLATGRTTLHSLIGWVLLNTFIPGRMLHWPSDKNRFVLGYVASIFVILALVLFGIYWWVALTAKQLAPSLAAHGFLGLPGLAAAVAQVRWWQLALTAIGTYLAFQVLYRAGELFKDIWGPHASGATPRELARERIVDEILLLGMIVLYLILWRLAGTNFYQFALAYAVYSLVALWLRLYFVNYIGDIQVYVTRDENTTLFVTRAAILTLAVQTIQGVLSSREDYDRVVVLGHSLGSVIGLDAIRELAARVNAGELPRVDFDRLAAFVTFGSPLEKTRFFFGRGAPRDDEGILHHFDEHVAAAMNRTRSPALGPIAWYNAWYFHDIISDRLVSYGPAVVDWPLAPRAGRGRAWWAWVHSDYFGDQEFMRPACVVALT